MTFFVAVHRMMLACYVVALHYVPTMLYLLVSPYDITVLCGVDNL